MSKNLLVVSEHSLASRPWRLLLSATLVLTLAACGSAPKEGAYYQDDGPGARPASEFVDMPDLMPRDEPLVAGTLRPYRVFDRQYIPMTERQPFRQSGVASWYGKQFQGKPTATGEPYDMYKLSAAHPTLPLPSYVRVRNLDNKRSVVVRVNDRGPFSNGRIIDLSFAAAAKLGYVDQGTTLVSIEVIDPVVVAMEQAHQPASASPVKLSTRKARALAPRAAAPAAPASLPVPAFTLAEPQRVNRRAESKNPLAQARDARGQRVLHFEPGNVRVQAAAPQVEVNPVRPAGGSTLAVRVETLQDEGLRPAVPEPDIDARRQPDRDPLAPRDWSRINESPGVSAERQQIAAISAEARRVELNERDANADDPLVFLQFGAYTTEKAAREDLYRYSGSFNSLFLPVQIVAERGLHKIQAGPFDSDSQAEAAIKRFRAESDLRPFYVYR